MLLHTNLTVSKKRYIGILIKWLIIPTMLKERKILTLKLAQNVHNTVAKIKVNSFDLSYSSGFLILF